MRARLAPERVRNWKVHTEIYRAAFESANAELTEINAEFEKLSVRKGQVEKLLAALKTFFGEEQKPAVVSHDAASEAATTDAATSIRVERPTATGAVRSISAAYRSCSGDRRRHPRCKKLHPPVLRINVFLKSRESRGSTATCDRFSALFSVLVGRVGELHPLTRRDFPDGRCALIYR